MDYGHKEKLPTKLETQTTIQSLRTASPCITDAIPTEKRPTLSAKSDKDNALPQFEERGDQIKEIMAKYSPSHDVILLSDLNSSLNRNPPNIHDERLNEFIDHSCLNLDVDIHTAQHAMVMVA